ncbi:hypothetical protein EJ07DRAFT_120760 [Lizonia empirigonia]|nr:hypothetical protein EJ07DRAFT_120760 [Lizonia empirigonia]
MDTESSSPILGIRPLQVDGNELTPATQPQDGQADRESSSDDIPLRQKRPPRASTRECENSHDVRDRRRGRTHMRSIKDNSSPDHRRATNQATLHESPSAGAESSGKSRKKPGPRPYASKPIAKNDMVAKKELIREIERFWGKGFIKAYIPKCHRPLVKRGKGSKRAMYRDHETDPMKWLPSVLKAILMIAKLTDDKAWLKKAMNNVHAGNRKPQLVTTDFDIIEDMLVNDWEVSYSFNIRYKHLMVNRKGQQETDEDIDHILGTESGQEDVSDDGGDDEDNEGNGSVDDEDDSDDDMGQGSLTGQYLHTSGYTSAPQYLRPQSGIPPTHPKTKEEKKHKRISELPLRPQPPPYNKKGLHAYGQHYPYGPPMDPWGRTMPYGSGPDGYGGYGGMYGVYGNYGPSPESDGHHPFQPQGFPGIGQYPPPRHAMTPVPSQPGTDRVQRHGYSQHFQPDQPEVKQESPEFEMRDEGRATSVGESDGRTNDIGEDSNAAAVEAELRATELELKVARLQAKRAALNQQSKAK